MMFFVFILAFSLIVGFCWAITRLFFHIPNKLGYRKVGLFLSYFVGLIFLIFFTFIFFEDKFFTKTDAKEILKDEEIILRDEFIITKNKSSFAIGDYTHSFDLEISESDKNRLISEIKNSKDFKKQGEPVIDVFQNIDQFKGKLILQNFETEGHFIKRRFQSDGGYWVKTVYIDKKSNVLSFVYIDE
jgi:energy-coupling factor transporter transmembrane protein EcfT